MTVLRDLRMPLGLTALVAGLLCASTAIGQPAPAAPVTASEDRDAAIFGQSKPAADDLGDPRMAGAVSERRDLLDDNRLQLGGLLYMRNGLFISDTPGENDRWSRQTLNSSNLMDLYLDARPNDRVRAFIRGRMLYTPVRDDSQASAFLGLGDTSEPVQMQLDQLWLKFDVARRIYLTAGAQHVRWGATRLWNPVDAIYPSRRNPLTLFDQRTGLPMLKLHVPFEVAGNNWSGYLIALADEAVDLAHMGLAGRLEAVVSTAEVGLTASKRIDDDWRLGLDLSAGVWEFDLTGELGVRVDGDGDVRWQVSGGVSWTVAINDEDSLIVGAEYFYNPNGYADGDAAAVCVWVSGHATRGGRASDAAESAPLAESAPTAVPAPDKKPFDAVTCRSRVNAMRFQADRFLR